MGRMAAHLALAAQDLTELNSLDVLMQIEVVFQTLDAEAQNLVLQDIQQATENYAEMVEVGVGFSQDIVYEYWSEVAHFLETGIISDRLSAMIRESRQ